MKILHLDSSILGEGSASRAISAAIVDQLTRDELTAEVTYRDLAAEPLPHLTLEAWMALDQGPDVEQFLDADVVVIGTGLYNFTVPTQLKAWVDRIAVKGKTFSYDENGVTGLASGKRVIIGLARGNVYGEASPYRAYEHAETLLRSTFEFVGADVEFIIAEGIGFGEDARKAALDGALEQASRLTQRAPAESSIAA
ncbi:FMN-dependent NADH-azoreductase [Sphingomonas guangdongensis]|uniref:FMN dependent NADH:quinone oxidoreductase n=1 Tax=Sphingomonas guangdongensis TaxID=1141890 RepID=A0A285QYW1_9SPHN|nr:NAD(P)H-dependent oxidoreductase [Sphingomonas guangdongensis]SOB87103.1 FMN-dependent NADH-azoreductase [Sphingomonas guangdongensis]